MKRTFSFFSILQATAVILAFATILWSLGLASTHFVEAASVTTYSDTLSTSEPSVASDHTITFTTPTGLSAGESIVLTFPAGFTGIDSLVAADVDLFVTVEEDLIDGAASGANWNVTASGQTVTITSGTDTMGANATATIEIGSVADGGSNQITNPTAGSYEIGIAVGGSDTGSTRVAIIAAVNVTASVDTLFTFTVTGVVGGEDVNGTTTGATTDATTIPFGQLDTNVASTAAQDLAVVTNAKNGFVVTVTSDGQLESSTGADIDGFRNGNYNNTPTGWIPPTVSIGSEETYGHWGITSDDTDHFAAEQTYVSASTTPVSVFTHNGPADGTTTGQGTTRVGYTVEISSLQEAAEDYTATLTYVATPVF